MPTTFHDDTGSDIMSDADDDTRVIPMSNEALRGAPREVLDEKAAYRNFEALYAGNVSMI